MVPLLDIALLFLKLGAIGFGGPIAIIALMETEACHRRKWLSSEEFERAYLYCKLLPGPVAYQMALWIGHHVRGRRGGLAAGIPFLLPAAALMILLCITYSAVQSAPAFQSLLEGMRAASIVVIVDSIVRMLKPYVRNVQAWTFIVVGIGLMLLVPRWEPLIILSGGLAMILYRRIKPRLASFVAPVVLWELFWVHFKASALVFGTGLAVIPVLQAEVVDRFAWMSGEEFLDGIAFGQITPGPVTITSVFVGFKVASFSGALTAFVGMYLPGILLVLFVVPLVIRRLEGASWLKDFQSGAIPMVIGCILGATVLLFKVSVTSGVGVGIFCALLLLAWRTKIPAWLLIPLGAGMSFVIELIR